MLSYERTHDDGRKSFPLVLVNWAPSSSEMSLLTLHASALNNFQNTVRRKHSRFDYEMLTIHVCMQADVGKVLEVRDGAEGLTTDAMNAMLTKA